MRVRNEETYQRKKAELMEACFAAYARGGLSSTGIKALADHLILKKEVTPENFMPIDLLTKENIDYYFNM